MTDEEQQVAIEALEDACEKCSRRCTGWRKRCTRG